MALPGACLRGSLRGNGRQLSGETASSPRRVFDYAMTTPCILSFDEFDAVGNGRGDVHETGEIKHIVSSLLEHAKIDRHIHSRQLGIVSYQAVEKFGSVRQLAVGSQLDRRQSDAQIGGWQRRLALQNSFAPAQDGLSTACYSEAENSRLLSVVVMS